MNTESLNDDKVEELVSQILDTCNEVDDNAVDFVPKKGMEFESMEDAITFYRTYAWKTGFGIKKRWGHSCEKTGILTSAKYCCVKEGVRGRDKRDRNIQNPRPQTRCGCLAHYSITLNRDNNKYVVSSFEPNHNHEFQAPKIVHMCSSCRKIAEVQGIEINMAEDAGLKVKEAYEFFENQAGERSYLGFTKVDRYRLLCAPMNELVTLATESHTTFALVQKVQQQTLKLVKEILQKGSSDPLSEEVGIPKVTHDVGTSSATPSLHVVKGKEVAGLYLKPHPIKTTQCLKYCLGPKRRKRNQSVANEEIQVTQNESTFTSSQHFIPPMATEDIQMTESESTFTSSQYFIPPMATEARQNSTDCNTQCESQNSVPTSELAPELSEADVWVETNLTAKGTIQGLGSEDVKDKCSNPSTSQSKKTTLRWFDTPEFQEYLSSKVVEISSELNARLEKQRHDTEELRKKVAELEKEKQENSLKKKAKIKLKQMMELLQMFHESLSKTQASDDNDDDDHIIDSD